MILNLKVELLWEKVGYMTYRGEIRKLFKLGYKENLSLNVYEKYIKTSYVFIDMKTKRVEYGGALSTEMLRELGVLK